MTLRCRRCNRAIKAQTVIERGILVTYGPTCARRMFAMPGRKVRTFVLTKRRIGVNQSELAQLELELEVA